MMGLWKKLTDLLFPPRCMFCRRVLDQGLICRDCAAKLERCGPVKGHGEFFSKCVAALYYAGDVRSALLRYKFNGRRAYAAGFAQLLAEVIRDEYPGQYDLITWAPISAKRLRERGYDQARLLAEQTAKLLDMEAVPTLRKTRHTKPNSSLKGREARNANVLGAYEALDPEAVRGRRVLLIDDIVTTGATLSECARMLLMAGAEDVICAGVAAARGKRGPSKN